MAEAVRRARLPREDRIRDIVAAARAVFCRRGFAAASIAEIAAAAGVAQGTIYKFFDTKRDLVLEVIGDWYDSMFATYAANLPGISGATNRFRYVVWRHIRFLADEPELCRLCSNEVRNGGDGYQGAISELNRKYSLTLLDICRDGMRDGEFRADLPIMLVRDLVFGGIDHHLSGFLYQGRPLDPDRVADQIVALLLDGMAARPAAAPPDAATARLERVAARLERLAGQHTDGAA